MRDAAVLSIVLPILLKHVADARDQHERDRKTIDQAMRVLEIQKRTAERQGERIKRLVGDAESLRDTIKTLVQQLREARGKA
jgi:hypothetical protein